MEGKPQGFAKRIQIRFYAELNDFVHPSKKQRLFDFPFRGIITVKDAIESLGVPHTAVDLVLVNGNPETMHYRLQPDDLVSVYPEFETFDISGISKNRMKPLRVSRFMVDAHMGKLAKKLRMLGFDTLFAGNLPDSEIIQAASAQKRIILTRDRDLLKSDQVDHGYYVRAVGPEDQLIEVISKFDLRSQFDPFSRCLVCNGELIRVEAKEVQDQINPDTFRIFSDFFRCNGCRRIFWEGSHYGHMMKVIEKLSTESGTSMENIRQSG